VNHARQHDFEPFLQSEDVCAAYDQLNTALDGVLKLISLVVEDAVARGVARALQEAEDRPYNRPSA
jgi:hypothetical protein